MLVAQVTAAAAALLCSLVAGFLFAFVVVVMPGIGAMDDGGFIEAFQEMDGVIQRGHPLFGLVWVGSIAAVIAAIGFGFGQLQGLDRLLLLAAGGGYLLGVQVPTIAINIPLNNEIQALDLEATDEAAWRSARTRFERRWNRWNALRTIVATVASATWLLLLLRY